MNKSLSTYFTLDELSEIQPQALKVARLDELNALIGYTRMKAGADAVEAMLNGMVSEVVAAIPTANASEANPKPAE